MVFCLEVVLQDSSIPMELQVFFGWEALEKMMFMSITFKLKLTKPMNVGNLRTFEI